MRAEDTLQYMMDFWGKIFPTRKHCLDHLFFTIGNGYEWVDGELVTKDSDFLDRWQLKEPIEYAKPAESVLATYYTRKRLLNIDGKDIDDWLFKNLSKYSKIYNLPDDIKDDWLDLAIEAIGYATDVDITIPGEISSRISELLKSKEKQNNRQ